MDSAGYCYEESKSMLFLVLFYFLYWQGYSRTRELDSEELLEQLPALQQLLYRLISCRVRIWPLDSHFSPKYLHSICILSSRIISLYAVSRSKGSWCCIFYFTARRSGCRQLCYTVCPCSGTFQISFLVYLLFNALEVFFSKLFSRLFSFY